MGAPWRCEGLPIVGTCAVMVSGCLAPGLADYATSRNTAIGAGVIALAGLVWMQVDNDPNASAFEEGLGDRAVAGFVVLPAAALAVFGLLGMAAYEDPEEAKQRAEQAEQAERVQRDAVTARRDRAWWLTKQAAAAARAGNCLQVGVFDREVRAADHDFHAMVFVRDVAIQRCLTQ